MAASPPPKRVRLHITPLTPSSAPHILPSSALASVSYHDIPTFPERSYAFADVEHGDAERVKKKYNGTIFRGVKMQVEEARPPRPDVRQKPTKTKKDKLSSSSKKAKDINEAGVKKGVELPKGRRVQRGWQGGDKKDAASRGSKCLFRTKLPADGDGAEAPPPKKSKTDVNKRQKLLKEFDKTTHFPSFLKEYGVNAVGKDEVSSEYKEGKGWVNGIGKVVQEINVRKRPEKVVITGGGPKFNGNVKNTSKGPAKKQVEESTSGTSDSDDDSDSESSSDNDSESESERENKMKEKLASSPSSSSSSSGSSSKEISSDDETATPKPTKISQKSASSSSSSSSSSDSEDSSDSSDASSEDQEDEEAVEQEKYGTNSPAIASEATIIASAPKEISKPPSLKLTTERISQANKLSSFFAPSGADNQGEGQFKFFGGEDEDDDMADQAGVVGNGYPMTPIDARYRSGAPTPDTAHPSRMMNSWLPASPITTKASSSQAETHSRQDFGSFGVGVVSGQHKLLFPHTSSSFLHGLSIWSSMPSSKMLTTGEVPDWRGAGKQRNGKEEDEGGEEEEQLGTHHAKSSNTAAPEELEEGRLPQRQTDDTWTSTKGKTGAGSGVVGWAGKKMKFDDEEDLPPLRPSLKPTPSAKVTTSSVAATTTKSLSGMTKAEIWKEVFYKKRGEWNREWKRRRKDALKTRRKKENAKRTGGSGV